MTKIQLTADDKAMFNSLKWYLDRGAPAQTFVEPTLYDRCLAERTIPVVHAWMRADDPERPKFQRLVDVMAEINRIQWVRIHDAMEKFEAHGLDYRLLKGFDLAVTCNPRRLPHSANDVDFLFQKSDLGKVHEILSDIGFRQGHINMTKKVVEVVPEYDGVVEDHYEVVGYIYPTVPVQLKQYKDLVDELCVPIPQLLAREDGVLFSTRFDVHYNLDVGMDETLFWEQSFSAPSPEGRMLEFLDRGVMFPFLCFKCYVETKAVTGRLRQFFDAAILAVRSESIDWDRVIRVARTPRFSEAVYYVSFHINDLLGDVVPQYVLEATMPKGRRQLHELRNYHHYGDFMPGLLGQATPIPLDFD